MNNKKGIRIFLGLTEVSGLYQGLAAGFKQLGIAVTRVDLANHPFKYNQHQEPLLSRIYHKSTLKQHRKTGANAFLWRLMSLLVKLLLFIFALVRHDVFIFSYGTSFFRLLDLRLLKLLRKKIIFQFHGSDSRPPFMDGSLIYHYSSLEIAKMTACKKKQITIINRFADAIIDIPPMGLFHNKKFINWLHIGLVSSITEVPHSSAAALPRKALHILHAPSNTQIKGTLLIEATIASLTQQGYSITLTKINNQSHEQVRAALSQCDLVIDQLFADYPMPGFATESAWFKKPVIICGYATKLWNEILAGEALPPTHYCHPEELAQAIKLFYYNRQHLRALGQQAFNFVSTKWSPSEVAKRYLRVINNTTPREWLCDPAHISYIHGCGVAEHTLQNFLKQYIAQEGERALMLQDKPLLKKRFLAFAQTN